MKPVRRGVRGNGNGNGKTSAKGSSTNLNDDNENKAQDPVEVYCRIRPLEDKRETSCIRVLTPEQLSLLAPDDSKGKKVTNFTFSHVFTEHVDQKEIFELIGIPLLEGLLQGKNGLLFTYGVTGSGKTYTMTGDINDPGLTPRCVDTLFNTISSSQLPKFVIKPDRMNGFEVQTETDAQEEREREYRKRKAKKSSSDSGILNYSNDGKKLEMIDSNMLYSVFVSYTEIYNNSVFDLLDENQDSKNLQSKILREDSQHNSYVNGVVELEVKSSEETFELYKMGQKRKKMGQTILNAESSRSHSIFTIRLVSGRVERSGDYIVDHTSLTVSQLSLVDLAGSERCNRTQATGQRLKEAGSINNSLMTLRTCLEILRDNQESGTKKNVPYRESRLTLLFKNFFDGEGKVEMVVCVNPTSKDYDENLHVMKFAQIAHEVKVDRMEVKVRFAEVDPTRTNPVPPVKSVASVSTQTNAIEFAEDVPKSAENDRQSSEFQPGPVLPVPQVTSKDPDSEEVKDLILYLTRRQERNGSLEDITNQGDEFRMKLVKQQAAKDEYERAAKNIIPQLRDQNNELQTKIEKAEYERDRAYTLTLEKEHKIEELNKEIKDMDALLKINQIKQKRKIDAVNEKMSHELDARLRRQRDILKAAMKEKDKKLELVKGILNDKPELNEGEIRMTVDLNGGEDGSQKKKVRTETQTTEKDCLPRRAAPVANPRYRRSLSTGDVWLEHRPPHPTPLGTVLQPVFKCRKSVSKLTDVKDVTNSKQSKYLLIDQGQDETGDLETKLYKGNIIPTCSGGAQVILDDVEKLKQLSPTGPSTSRAPEAMTSTENSSTTGSQKVVLKRSVPPNSDLTATCQIIYDPCKRAKK